MAFNWSQKPHKKNTHVYVIHSTQIIIYEQK